VAFSTCIGLPPLFTTFLVLTFGVTVSLLVLAPVLALLAIDVEES